MAIQGPAAAVSVLSNHNIKILPVNAGRSFSQFFTEMKQTMDIRNFISKDQYFLDIIVEVYKRMDLKSDEPWLTPDEMYQKIQKADPELFKQIESFFASYEEWYNKSGAISQDEFKAKRKLIVDYLDQRYGE